MTKMKIVVSPEALNELRGIKEYISVNLTNPTSAERITDKIIDTIGRLAESPELGPSLDPKVEFHTDLRYLVVGKYIVVYQARKEKKHVARIFYGGMDYISVLFPNDFD